MSINALTIDYPAWCDPFLQQRGQDFPTYEARMQFAIDLAQANVDHQTGGPFGAAVFEHESGMLISMGINLVVNQRCSLAHAEMLALSQAQQALGQHSLAPDFTGKAYQLATTVAPCAMCLGAIPWSGITGLICGARAEDAQAIGFDEGAKPADWLAALAQRKIDVMTDVLRDQAQAVLVAYQAKGGRIY